MTDWGKNRVSSVFHEILQSVSSYTVTYDCFGLMLIILNISKKFREIKCFCPWRKAISQSTSVVSTVNE